MKSLLDLFVLFGRENLREKQRKTKMAKLSNFKRNFLVNESVDWWLIGEKAMGLDFYLCFLTLKL